MSKNQKIVFGVIAAVLVAVGIFFTACTPKQTNPAEGKDDVIKIGAILPLTGNLAYLGQEEQQALLFAAEDLNADNTKPKIEFVFEDSKGTAKDGVTAYLALKTKGVSAIISGLTIVSEAIRPNCEEDGLLQIALSVDPTIAPNGKTTLRPYYGLEDEAKILAKYINENGKKKIAALYIDVPECQRAIDSILKPMVIENGGEFVGTETYGFQNTTLRNQLTKIASLAPDAIVTVDFGYQYPIILREALELGIREKIIGGLGMMTAPEMDARLTEGIVFCAAGFVVSPSASYQSFVERFAPSGIHVTFDGVYTYDSAVIIGDGLRNGLTKKQDYVGKTFSGISGDLHINNDGNASVDIQMGQYVGNKIVKLSNP